MKYSVPILAFREKENEIHSTKTVIRSSVLGVRVLVAGLGLTWIGL